MSSNDELRRLAVPEDVRRAAIQTAADFWETKPELVDDDSITVALLSSAILTERERCRLEATPSPSTAGEVRVTDEMVEALTECLEYFENRQDADFNSEDGFIPNKEMMMASMIKRALGEA